VYLHLHNTRFTFLGYDKEISKAIPKRNKERDDKMKLSNKSVFVLVLLFIIIGAEFYYLKYYAHQSNEVDKNTTTEYITPAKETSNELKEKEDVENDKKIIVTVESYRKGYKEGCRQASKVDKPSPQKVTRQDRAYQLGFERGKEVCLLKIKKKKEKKKEIIPKKLVEKKARADKKSPDYQNGYRHGCNSAKGEYLRMEDIYLQSRDYREGWTTGRQKCQGIKKSTIPTQKPNYFDQGYRDGCDSAEGFYRRDARKYMRVPSYTDGWRIGEYECGGAFY